MLSSKKEGIGFHARGQEEVKTVWKLEYLKKVKKFQERRRREGSEREGEERERERGEEE